MKNWLALIVFVTGLGMILFGLYEAPIRKLFNPPTPYIRLEPLIQKTATRPLVWKTLAPIPTFTRVPTFTPYGYTPCDCSGPDLDCPDFADPSTAQDCFDHCWSLGLRDIYRLDRDGDGLVCEPAP